MAKIYISGKIGTASIDDVRPKFNAAESRLRSFGYETINPLDCHDKDDLPRPNPSEWAHYMLNDIAEVFECDGIYMLACWQDSPGARIEHSICQIMGKTIYYEATEIN